MKYCVTGAAGFIGSNICERLLNEDHEVVGVDNLINGNMKNVEAFMGDPKFKIMLGDLCEPGVCRAACDGADFVLHQAALGSVPRSVEDPQMTTRNNVVSTLNVLVAAKDAHVKRLVYASSASVYGNVEGGTLHEEMVPNPYNPYAASKMAAEVLVRTFWYTYNMPTVCLRYFNVFGPRQNPAGPYAAVVPRFINMLTQGKSPTIYGDGEQARDFTFVDNVVEANLAACNRAINGTGEVFNVAAGGFTTVNELCAIVAEEIGIVADPIYLAQRPGDVRGSRADIRKAQRVLGYQPVVQIREGIRRTVEWMK